MKRVVFMGTPDFAVNSLEALIQADYEVVGVFTQPDKPVGRKAVLTPSPVKLAALAHDIPVYQPARIRSEENFPLLRELNPDVIVVAAYGQIIPKSILDLPRYGCINVHASLLPAWRGAAPIQWSILAGDEKSGVTIMQMGEGLDTGDMLAKAETAIRTDETGGSLFDRLAEMSGPLLIDTLKKLECGEITAVPQPEESTTPYASPLRRESGRIDWTHSAAEIERQVRALDPWPGTYTYIQGKQLKIWGAYVAEAGTDFGQQPGQVSVTADGALLAQCGEGALVITALQLEGKKRMDSQVFLRGYHLEEQTVLTNSKG